MSSSSGWPPRRTGHNLFRFPRTRAEHLRLAHRVAQHRLMHSTIPHPRAFRVNFHRPSRAIVPYRAPPGPAPVTTLARYVPPAPPGRGGAIVPHVHRAAAPAGAPIHFVNPMYHLPPALRTPSYVQWATNLDTTRVHPDARFGINTAAMEILNTCKNQMPALRLFAIGFHKSDPNLYESVDDVPPGRVLLTNVDDVSRSFFDRNYRDVQPADQPFVDAFCGFANELKRQLGVYPVGWRSQRGNGSDILVIESYVNVGFTGVSDDGELVHRRVHWS